MTVIICTRDRLALLEACLDAVGQQSYPRFDVLVVDNGTAGSARDLCRRRGVSWVPAPVPGLTPARNVGARHARGDLIAYIDDDAVVEAGWLDALVAAFGEPGTGAVTGRVRYMKALADSRGMSSEEAEENGARIRGAYDRQTPNWFAVACFGGVGDGGNMAFRRELFAEGLRFDERIGRGRLLDSGDEHVVFATLIARGHTIVHAPDAVARHPSPPTPELQLARRYCDLSASISHLLFVWGEFPAYRTDILRFVLRAVVRRIVPGRKSLQRGRSLSLKRLQALKAMVDGMRTYRQATKEWAASADGVPRQARPRASAVTESTSTSR